MIVVVAGVMFAPSDFTRHLRPIVPHGSVRPPQSGNNWLSTNKITTDKRVDPRLRDYSADVQDSIFLPGGTAAAACAQSTVFRGVRWTRMRFLPPSLPLPPLCVEEVAFGTRTQGGLMPPANRKKEKEKPLNLRPFLSLLLSWFGLLQNWKRVSGQENAPTEPPIPSVTFHSLSFATQLYDFNHN